MTYTNVTDYPGVAVWRCGGSRGPWERVGSGPTEISFNGPSCEADKEV
jgi:hypothetical protein